MNAIKNLFLILYVYLKPISMALALAGVVVPFIMNIPYKISFALIGVGVALFLIDYFVLEPILLKGRASQ